MRVNNIQSNDTSFGAKLVIRDNQKILNGSMRTMRHSLDEVRSFSNDELKLNSLESNIKSLKKTIKDTSVSEMVKHFEVSGESRC